jgi:hypothetical protein
MRTLIVSDPGSGLRQERTMQDEFFWKWLNDRLRFSAPAFGDDANTMPDCKMLLKLGDHLEGWLWDGPFEEQVSRELQNLKAAGSKGPLVIKLTMCPELWRVPWEATGWMGRPIGWFHIKRLWPIQLIRVLDSSRQISLPARPQTFRTLILTKQGRNDSSLAYVGMNEEFTQDEDGERDQEIEIPNKELLETPWNVLVLFDGLQGLDPALTSLDPQHEISLDDWEDEYDISIDLVRKGLERGSLLCVVLFHNSRWPEWAQKLLERVPAVVAMHFVTPLNEEVLNGLICFAIRLYRNGRVDDASSFFQERFPLEWSGGVAVCLQGSNPKIFSEET